MMRAIRNILLFLLFFTITGCSNTRFLAENQTLYTGRKSINIKSEQSRNTSSAKKYVKSITSHKINNSLFGRRVFPPVGLWIYNYIKPKGKSKLGNWLYGKLSSAPVLISDVNPDLRITKIEKDLFDRGYFNAHAWAVVDTNFRNNRKAKISYFVSLHEPATFDKIKFDTASLAIDSIFDRAYFNRIIKTGEQYNLEKLKNAREGLLKNIQENGYFYFVPEYVEILGDTATEKNRVNLFVERVPDLPDEVLHRYRLNDIIIKVSRHSDSTQLIPDTILLKDFIIISPENIIKPDILLKSVFFSKGDIYSYDAYKRTVNQLNNLGIFSLSNVSFRRNMSDSLSYLLDVMIDLVVADNINLTFESDVITKSTGFAGPALSVGITDGNVFKGAEKLHLSLNGRFEWQWGPKAESQISTNSYEFGLSSGLTLPRIIFPLTKGVKNGLAYQRMAVNLDVNILNRTAYYQMFSFKTNLNYMWGNSDEISHIFYPVYMNWVNLINTTQVFDSVVADNIYIRKSFDEQFILGAKYDFAFNNTLTVKQNNWFLQAGISTSGNLIYLLSSIGGKKGSSELPSDSRKRTYSQFVKLTTDLRYYRNGFKNSLALRFFAGIGVPYGNSTSLPYIEQFFSGGAYSLRGFASRSLGPGAFHEEKGGYIDQSGDIKLEMNAEFRFDMSKILNGALFIETGNTWLVHEDKNRPGSKFNLNSFYNQLAVGSGFGLRFDFGFLVLRTDIGFPLRTPYQTDSTNWLFGTGKIFKSGLLNLAIGYPF